MPASHYWVVRFDYDVPLRNAPDKCIRQTGRIGVVAASVMEAISAVATKPEYTNAIVWAVNHQGPVDLEVE